MFGVGQVEIMIIMLALLLFFGASRIPSLAKGLGSGIRIFKDALKGEDENPAIEKKQEETKSDKPSS